MAKKSFISITQINHLMSSISASKKRLRLNEFIKSQSGSAKEILPYYVISKFEFNETTRIAHIEFLETKKYKRIERYITRNYVKYPVYSGWITKTKIVKKVLKLTNQELESLLDNNDALIQEFAYEIIDKLNNESLIPAWYMEKVLLTRKEEKISNNNYAHNEYKNKCKSKQKELRDEISKLNLEKHYLISKLEKKIKKRDKFSQKLQKSIKRNDNVFLTIISFGYYYYLKSNKRLSKLKNIISKYTSEIDAMTHKMNALTERIDFNTNEVNRINNEIDKHKSKTEKLNEIAKEEYKSDLANIEQLPLHINCENSDFIPLKKIIGVEYEKIVGCYIIHNKEFNKYYVGQSKDVLRRLKEHFNGTTVKNIIFAEDYYKSSYEDKSDIFEVKIIKLSTKDELDSVEKDLIEQYDAFAHGYNGTNGNN